MLLLLLSCQLPVLTLLTGGSMASVKGGSLVGPKQVPSGGPYGTPNTSAISLLISST